MNPNNSNQSSINLGFNPNLQHYNHNEHQNRQVQELIKQKYEKSREMLDLFNCKNKWDLILKHKDWSMIKQLGLTDCSISNNQKIPVITSQPWPKLTHLFLSDNKIRCKGTKLLIKTQFPQLKQLWLFGCQIGNQGLRNLTKSSWPKLKILHLSDNKIGVDGYFSICGNNWKEINQIRTTQNQNDPIVLYGFFGQVSPLFEKLLIIINNNQIDSDLRPIVESVLKK